MGRKHRQASHQVPPPPSRARSNATKMIDSLALPNLSLEYKAALLLELGDMANEATEEGPIKDLLFQKIETISPFLQSSSSDCRGLCARLLSVLALEDANVALHMAESPSIMTNLTTLLKPHEKVIVRDAAAAAVSNVTCGGETHKEIVPLVLEIVPNVIERLIDCLRAVTKDPDLYNSSLCALSNFAAASSSTWAILTRADVLTTVTRFTQLADPEVRLHSHAVLSNLARSSEANAKTIGNHPACLPALLKSIEIEDYELQSMILRTLNALAESDAAVSKRIADSVLQRVEQMERGSAHSEVRTSACILLETLRGDQEEGDMAVA